MRGKCTKIEIELEVILWSLQNNHSNTLTKCEDEWEDNDWGCAQAKETRKVCQISGIAVKRSKKIFQLTQRYSHSIYYLLLIDDGELEYYKEAIQVEDSNE